MGRRAMTARQLACAYALDWVAGDPEWFPHPVRLFGLLKTAGERVLRPVAVGPGRELVVGGVLTAVVVTAAWVMGRPKNAVWQVMLGWTALATRSLLDEAVSVIEALEANDLELARRRLSRIVGRDTGELDEVEISRAVIETLAESACDGIVAPLFWMAVGGVPAAMAYKAINTLDSMIGHKDERYLYFGRVAARLDDAVNFVPARITAAGIAAAAFVVGRARSVKMSLDAANMNVCATPAWRAWRRDGGLHDSPNAGQSEAAMAGALGVRLGGRNVYSGVVHHSPLLNPEGAAASIGKARMALSLVAVVSGLAFVAAFFARRRR